MKCDSCDRDAVVHITEIRRGILLVRHLCETCADMLLPLEESDYSEYLDALPPRHAEYAGDEAAPTPDELEMTGMKQHVLVVDLSTGERERVGLKSGDTLTPVWSPDGTHLALCHMARMRPSLVIARPGTASLRRFLHTQYAEPATWAPDGKRAAFSHFDEGLRIAVIDLDGDLLTHIEGEEDVNDFRPAWSPADDRVAFVGMRLDDDDEEPTVCTLMTANAKDGKRRRVARMLNRSIITVGWSADARLLAAQTIPLLSAGKEDFDEDVIMEQKLYLFRADADDEAPEPLVRGATAFAWLPRVDGFSDGPALIVAESHRDDPNRIRLALIDPAKRRRVVRGNGLVFAGALHAGQLARDQRTFAALHHSDYRRIALVDLATDAAREIDAGGEVAWLARHPVTDDLVVLVRDDAGARLDVLSPTGASRTVAQFKRDEFRDVPLFALSPDGSRAAVEAHAPKH